MNQKEKDHLRYLKERTRRKAYQSNYQKANKDRLSQYNKERTERLWQEVLAGYGSKCECCGETTEEFLTVDHVNNDGAKDRDVKRAIIYLRIIREGFPAAYRILCMNCNWGRRYTPDSKCPHEKGSKVGKHI